MQIKFAQLEIIWGLLINSSSAVRTHSNPGSPEGTDERVGWTSSPRPFHQHHRSSRHRYSRTHSWVSCTSQQRWPPAQETEGASVHLKVPTTMSEVLRGAASTGVFPDSSVQLHWRIWPWHTKWSRPNTDCASSPRWHRSRLGGRTPGRRWSRTAKFQSVHGSPQTLIWRSLSQLESTGVHQNCQDP